MTTSDEWLLIRAGVNGHIAIYECPARLRGGPYKKPVPDT